MDMQNIPSCFNDNQVISKNLVSAGSDNTDDFSSFLTKSVDSQFTGSVTMQHLTTLFPKILTHNVLRKHCLCITTDSSSVEVPCTNDVIISTLPGANNNNTPSVPVRISLSDEYAKWLIPRSLFNKIHGYPAYLKSVFADSIAALERALFVSGKPGAFDGILALLDTKSTLVFQLADSQITLDRLFELKFALPDRYRKDAVFIMSSSALQIISALRDNNGRMIFDGVNKILGHEVEVLDELGTTILFSDFQQSTVLAEKRHFKIEMHSSFDDPSKVGLSLPISVGVGIVNHDAIVYATFTTANANRQVPVSGAVSGAAA